MRFRINCNHFFRKFKKQTYSSTLVLLDVDKDRGFSMHGTVDHSPYYNIKTNWYWYNQDIRRSIFMDDYIYAISDRAVTAHQVKTGTVTYLFALLYRL